jgi:hypothetical protein
VASRVLVEHGLIEPPDPDGPGVFALADPVRLTALLDEAGFTDITVEPIDIVQAAPSFEFWWEMLLALSPSGAAVRAADPAVAKEVAGEVEQRLDRYRLAIPGRVLVASAEA